MGTRNKDGDGQEYVPKEKKGSVEIEKRRKKILPGSLMKAKMRPGEGDARPSDGDQVIYHCTIRTLDGIMVESTITEHGGKGIPRRQVLGKSKMLLGLIEGIPTMSKGEIAMFKVKPEMHYGEPKCPVSPPSNFPMDVELHFEINLIDFSVVKVVNDDLRVIKKVICEGQGWESPMNLCELETRISAKTGDGRSIFCSRQYDFTFGRSQVPKGLEMGIGTMTQAEKAIIYVTSPYLNVSPLMSMAEDFEELSFVVELVHFVQVRDIFGDSSFLKRRIRDGIGDFPMDCPLSHGCLIRVHCKFFIMLPEKQERALYYDTRGGNNEEALEFCSGQGKVPDKFESCVSLMLQGEIALLTCPPGYTCDGFPGLKACLPVGAHFQCEIELLSFEKPKDWSGLDFPSILEEAEKIREVGNNLFREGRFELAKTNYEMLLREFNHVHPLEDDEVRNFTSSRDLLFLNMAACYLKMGENKKSIKECNKILDANPTHAKALYRRGMAYTADGDFEEAEADFNKMMKADEASRNDARHALEKLKLQKQRAAIEAREQFKGFFDKKPRASMPAIRTPDENEAETCTGDDHHGSGAVEKVGEIQDWLPRCTIL